MDAFTPEDRLAMRVYLQRNEVRLSTMHRVASAFLGGAGLLILFPVFFNNAVAGLIKALIIDAKDFLSVTASALLGVSLFISVTIPVYALYLLLRDLTHFYFVGHSPGFPTTLFNPRFVLSGVAFSTDESPAVKKAIEIRQYSTDLVNFIIPFGETQAQYFKQVIDGTDRKILPIERTIEKLEQQGVVNGRDDDNNLIIASNPTETRSVQDVERFAAAFGLAGTRDRPLVAEVAKLEASLVRHALGLRRLVLRYMKALLTFILTTLLSFVLIALINTDKLQSHIVLAIGYMVWALLLPFFVRIPVRWIYETSDPRSGSVVQHDSQLQEFEKFATKCAWLSFVLSAVALTLGVWELWPQVKAFMTRA